MNEINPTWIRLNPEDRFIAIDKRFKHGINPANCIPPIDPKDVEEVSKLYL